MKRITITSNNAFAAIAILLGCGCCALLVPKFYELISEAFSGTARAEQIIFSFYN